MFVNLEIVNNKKGIIISKLVLYFKIAIVALGTIYYATKVILNSIFSKSKTFYRKNATKWSAFILRVFKVKVEAKGLEQLKPSTTYILASNHSSMFDIPIMFTTFKDFNYIIIYKKELQKIPVLGGSLKVSPFVSIERTDPRKAMESIQTTLNQMQENDCPIIFPEGTRSEDGKLGTFKRGAFLIASKSLKPIVPIALKGSSEILQKGSLNVKGNAVVEVVINPPIENNEELNRVQEKELMNKVYEQIKTSLDQ